MQGGPCCIIHCISVSGSPKNLYTLDGKEGLNILVWNMCLRAVAWNDPMCRVLWKVAGGILREHTKWQTTDDTHSTSLVKTQARWHALMPVPFSTWSWQHLKTHPEAQMFRYFKPLMIKIGPRWKFRAAWIRPYWLPVTASLSHTVLSNKWRSALPSASWEKKSSCLHIPFHIYLGHRKRKRGRKTRLPGILYSFRIALQVKGVKSGSLHFFRFDAIGFHWLWNQLDSILNY